MMPKDDVEALAGEFMHQQRCSLDVTTHVLVRVTQALGLTDVEALLDVLGTLEAETCAAPGQFAGEGLRRARILRTLYDLFVLSLLPGGHAACRTVLATTAALISRNTSGQTSH
jgi:hypothetical protein